MINELASRLDQILSAKTAFDQRMAISALSNSFHASVSRSTFFHDSRPGSTAGGVALSAKHAADCIDDWRRTYEFILGTHSALNFLVDRNEDKPISILYAGCGPFAPLILPILCLHPMWNIELQLLEFNKDSISFVHELLTKIPSIARKTKTLECDATSVDLGDQKFDLIINETMNRALIEEPQAFTTINLMKYLKHDGIWLPESIELSLKQSKFTTLNLFASGDNGAQPTEDNSQHLGKFCMLDPKKGISNCLSNLQWTPWFEYGAYNPNQPDVIISTEVRVFQDHSLNSGESYITNPLPLVSRINDPDLTSVRLKYVKAPKPHWIYEQK